MSTQRADLGAELQVGHDDGDFGACDDQNDEDEEQEPEKIVHLVFPDGLWTKNS